MKKALKEKTIAEEDERKMNQRVVGM